MTYRRVLAWLQNGPALVQFEQGKGNLQFAAPEAAPSKAPLGLPSLEDLAPPPRTAARPPATIDAAPPAHTFK
jgi:hypothetical protein